MQLSRSVRNCADDPMLPYQQLAEQAIHRGKEVFYLNRCQSDINTSEIFYAAAGSFVPEVLSYAPARGLSIMTEALQGYYRMHGMNYAQEDILVTNGASEALLLAMQCVLDPGSEVIVPEPFYPNYRTVITACGGELRPLFSAPEENYRYAVRERIELLIGPKTRAILCCNPCNPTGAVLTHTEMLVLADIAREYGLWLIADEVYREFVYEGESASFGQLPKIDQQLILLDSTSKRFSASGARVGALITKNKELMACAHRLAQARLSVATLDQVASAELYLMDDQTFSKQKEIFRQRRDLCVAALRSIPGVVCMEPRGAYYLMVRLPVDDCDRFQRWMLEQFESKGQTLLLAPGSGFYATPGCGRSEVRISYVMENEKLQRAMELLAEALRQYPGTTQSSLLTFD